MNRKLCLSVLLFIGATCSAAFTYGRKPGTSIDAAAEIIIFRQIGHQLLLAAGDSVSRVLPVEQIADNEYELRFENAFAFQPDSLIQIVSRCLAASTLPEDYVVNVIECSKKEVVYGFAIGAPAAGNTPACTNRAQPSRCYRIQIIFPEQKPLSNKGMVWAAGASVLALTGLSVWWGRQRKHHPKVSHSATAVPADMPVSIGTYLFYPKQQLLVWQQQEIMLTIKESKLLGMFIRNINEMISREQLQKEGWEDEGVITGRSLDMYVSKLRKHLQYDAAVKLVNIHGRGYKLEVNAVDKL